jgi:hypothetical protein
MSSSLTPASLRSDASTESGTDEDTQAYDKLALDDCVNSPVPLNPDESQNAEIRALAAKLAPDFEQADALLQVPFEFQSHPSFSVLEAATSEDDDMDREMESLQFSEALLRQELELAQDFSTLFQTVSHNMSNTSDAVDKFNLSGTPFCEGMKRQLFDPPDHQSADGSPALALQSSSSREADIDPSDGNKQEECSLEIDDDDCPDKVLSPIRIPSPVSSPNGKSTATTSSSPEVDQGPRDSSILLTAGTPSRSVANPIQPYTHKDHFTALRLSLEEQGGWYSVDLTSFVVPPRDTTTGNLIGLKDYCLAIPESKLKHLYVGLPDAAKPGPDTTVTGCSQYTLPLPVRTLAIPVRPDVLCGAIMDAVHQVLTSTAIHARILKRQGGHLRGIISGCVVPRDPDRLVEESFHSKSSAGELEGVPSTYPPFLIDAQLCTAKSDSCERVLLLRVYHCCSESIQPSDDVDNMNTSWVTALSQQNPAGDHVLGTNHFALVEHLDIEASTRLRECCALVQRVEAPELSKRIRSPGKRFDNRESMQTLVSSHLLEHYRACPSVREGSITLPSLNSDDWPVIQSSWRFVQATWEELETRDLTYTTLTTARFGAFPALPTLDVHYCSQIRRFSREVMIMQLLKSASELEEYAREAEYACANMISLLQPTFDAYGMEAPLLPKPVPLNEYPLDFTPPQQACPPWGLRVMEALNETQALTSDAGRDEPILSPTTLYAIDASESLAMARRAVSLILNAFQIQDDEEKGARLGRKNLQVMDRLAKMQAHQRTLIQSLQNGIALSEKAAKAADDFHRKAGVMEVPLLKWNIVVGGASGTCSVTAKHLLFITQLIPVIGGSRTAIFRISEVDFDVQESTPSILNPLPTVVSVRKDGQQIYSFRPSAGGKRLKSVLETIKATALDQDALPESPSSA